MVQAISHQAARLQWIEVCSLTAISPNTGICAWVNQQQIAIFRVGDGSDLYALSNYDPFSKAYVLSRGLIGDRQGTLKVASPIYKQNFNLLTGVCLDDPTVSVHVFPVRAIAGQVQVGVTDLP